MSETLSQAPKYSRIILKISGEALKEKGSSDSVSPQIVRAVAASIAEVRSMGIEVAVVVGGGNIWRGLAALEDLGHATRVQTAIQMNNVAEPFIVRKAIRHLENGRIVIFVAGTGNPFFSTDTTAALRANEIGAEVILKATKVDGIYDSDPKKNPDAKRFETLTYSDALTRRLEVMDSTAFSLCMDNAMPIIVFDMSDPANILRAVRGEKIGTLVCDDKPAF